MHFPEVSGEAKFHDIRYLSEGNDRQRTAFALLRSMTIMELLAPFDPVLAGTIPIEIDIPGSDLDILCNIGGIEPQEFTLLLKETFGKYESFYLDEISDHKNGPVVIASFLAGSFPIEIFAQNKDTTQQNAFRHMIVEYRVLSAMGDDFRKRVVELKRRGLKTEPAFAVLLALAGDPYEAVLSLGE